MSHIEKKAYADAIRKRYKQVKRSEKAAMLDEFCAICRCNRSDSR